MKKRIIIALILLISLTTITFDQKIIFSIFALKKITIENNSLLKENDIKKSLKPIYDKNLLQLNNKEIKKILLQNSLIDSFKIKKKYPNTLKIEIFEKKPIAILFDKKQKFYISEKIELLDYNMLNIDNNLPYVLGNKDDFKIFYDNLRKIKFPFNSVKKYILYENNRWDLETLNNKTIKLSAQNYKDNLEHYLNLINKKEFKKYNLYDFRIKNQLILK
jgi:cell division septal protein FtsQ